MLTIDKIVVPLDLSEHSLVALDYAVGLAERYDARIDVVFVNEPHLQLSDLAWVGVDERLSGEAHLQEARRSLEKIVLDRVPTGVPVDANLLTGEAVDEIVRFAEAEGADLIVMATRGLGKITSAILGSTAHEVLRRSPCPVLTLRHPKVEKQKPN